MHRHTGPKWSILVWGVMGYHSRTPLFTPPAATPDHQINFGNVWKLLGLMYHQNTFKVSLNQCRGVWQRRSPTMATTLATDSVLKSSPCLHNGNEVDDWMGLDEWNSWFKSQVRDSNKSENIVNLNKSKMLKTIKNYGRDSPMSMKL
ncbi:uncharacterized protein TNCV_582301 [Trichonephila clavipes]|nr:uncharacterized protein TNCV_582301 [Trichonephila clavipes]